MNVPLRFQPYLRPMVWGGRRLGDFLHKQLPTAEPYGESWEVSDHASHRTALAGGGPDLHELMQSQRDALLGAAAPDYSSFPWLVKFLDANDWLSVQVHPDEAAVARLWPGEQSKTEAWFILDAAPSSKVYAGLLPGVDEPRLRAALAAGTVADCLHQFQPRPGDCLFLPAGTVHAVGGGVLMAEVQQTSDATFRLFDWNRKDAAGKSRQLHIEESLACIHWDAGPRHPVRAIGYPAAAGERPAGRAMRQEMVRCRYFVLEYRCEARPFPFECGRLQVVVGLHGQGMLETAAGPQSLGIGETAVLPASLAPTRCVPDGPLGLLVCTLPDSA